MRIHGQDIIAVNFRELVELEALAFKVLRGLLHVAPRLGGVGVYLRWDGQIIFVEIAANGSTQKYNLSIPDGVSGEDCAVLLSLKLQNYLLSGNKFELWGNEGNMEEKYIYLRLKHSPQKTEGS